MITEEQNNMLMREVTPTNIEEIVMEMPKNKAPEPDGFIVEFFQEYQQIIGKEVVRIVEDSRKSPTLLTTLDATFIDLVPKKKLKPKPQLTSRPFLSVILFIK